MPGVSIGSGVRCAGLDGERDDAGPDVERVVLVIVDRRAGAHLRRRLVERQGQHARALELLGVGGRTSSQRPGTRRSVNASSARMRSSGPSTGRASPRITTER